MTQYKRINGSYELTDIEQINKSYSYEIIANPLSNRHNRESMRSRYSGLVNCGSHNMFAISIRNGEWDKTRRDILIVVIHGGGLEFVKLPPGSRQIIDALISGGDETTLYWSLRSFIDLASDTANEVRRSATLEVLEDYAEKRIRKRTARGQTTYKVETRAQKERRLLK